MSLFLGKPLVGVGMRKISGFCERCDNFSQFLQRREGFWLCTVCRDEVTQMGRTVMPPFGPFFFTRR